MKQKNILVILSIILFVTASPIFAKPAGDIIAGGVGRGTLNIITSPAELPHHLIYDIDNKGSIGILTGFGKGLVFTFGRMLTGLGDFLSLGFAQENENLYESLNMKTYVWEEAWNAPEYKSYKKTKNDKINVSEKNKNINEIEGIEKIN